jgi:hypothetical protein
MKELNGKCYLYVIQAGEHFKIGISANPRKRMRMIDTELFVDVELKCAIPFDTRRDSEQEEASIQAELSEFHVKGEWFKLPYTSISNVIAAHGLGRNQG